MHVIVNYARAAHVFSAGIECRHCTPSYVFSPNFCISSRTFRIGTEGTNDVIVKTNMTGFRWFSKVLWI